MEIAGHPVGPGHPPVFLAEIGTLFGQDVGAAKRLIDGIAAAARAVPELPVMVKGEILHDPDVCLDDETLQSFESRSGQRASERYRSVIERKVVPLEKYAEIFAHCRAVGLHWAVSVYDREGTRFAADQQCAALKSASFNIVHVPLLREMAGIGVPVLVDTGRATLGEIDRAVRTLDAAGCRDILINHNPDGHPAPPRNHNLRSLATLAATFGRPIGLADHYMGHEMMCAAIALGASLVEKPIAIDPDALDVEHAWSIGIDAIPETLRRLHDVWQGLGEIFRPDHMDGLISTSARMALVARQDMKAGEEIGADTVTFAFPAKGIGVEQWDLVHGWKMVRDIAAREPIEWSDVSPGASR